MNAFPDSRIKAHTDLFVGVFCQLLMAVRSQVADSNDSPSDYFELGCFLFFQVLRFFLCFLRTSIVDVMDVGDDVIDELVLGELPRSRNS